MPRLTIAEATAKAALTGKPEVTVFSQRATYTGAHIGMRSAVCFPDGYVQRFTERMPKGRAIQQANELRARDAARNAK